MRMSMAMCLTRCSRMARSGHDQWMRSRRVIEDPIAAADSLGPLARAGLIHRLNGFVFASRAALHADQIMLQNELSE